MSIFEKVMKEMMDDDGANFELKELLTMVLHSSIMIKMFDNMGEISDSILPMGGDGSEDQRAEKVAKYFDDIFRSKVSDVDILDCYRNIIVCGLRKRIMRYSPKLIQMLIVEMVDKGLPFDADGPDATDKFEKEFNQALIASISSLISDKDGVYTVSDLIKDSNRLVDRESEMSSLVSSMMEKDK